MRCSISHVPCEAVTWTLTSVCAAESAAESATATGNRHICVSVHADIAEESANGTPNQLGHGGEETETRRHNAFLAVPVVAAGARSTEIETSSSFCLSDWPRGPCEEV